MNSVAEFYERRLRKRRHVTVFAKYLSWRCVPKLLKRRIREYVSFVWDVQEDHPEHESAVLSALSPQLRGELLHSIYGGVFHTLKFLDWMHPSHSFTG